MTTETLYHIADIHISNNIERHEEYKKVIDKTVEIISKDTSKKIIVLVGDIFHDKTILRPESIELAKYMLTRMSDICKVIIVDGNHDININNNKRMSSIKATIQYINTKNEIHYITDTNIKTIEGINYVLTPMESKVSEFNRIQNQKYVGLYHGTLYKSKTDSYTFNDESKIKASDFDNYDIVLLGDIHKFQYMNVKKTIAYSGSLIQQNHGESIDNHGMIKWNLKDNTSKYIEIENEYIFKTILLDNTNINKYDIEGIENKKTRLRIKYKDIEKKDLDQFISQIRKKYKIINLTKEEIFEIKRDNEQTISIDNKNVIEYYDEYIKENNNISLQIKKHNIDIRKRLTNLVDEYNTNNIKQTRKNIKINKIEFSNLFAYGEYNVIDFNKLSNLNLLCGKNATGKSSIIDIILWGIYNKFSRGSHADALNIKYNNGYSIIQLEVNGIKYTIERKISKKTTITNSVILYEGYINHKDIKSKNLIGIKNISNTTKKMTDIDIIEKFGSYEDLISTSIILQVGQNFVDVSDENKRKFLMKVLGLMSIESIRNTCSQRIRKHDDIGYYKAKLNDINYKEKKKEIEIAIDEYKEDIKNIKEEIENINKEINTINVEQIRLYNKNSKTLEEETIELEIELDNLKQNINHTKYTNNDINKIIKKIEKNRLKQETIQKKILNISLDKHTITTRLNNTRLLITNSNKEIEKLTKEKENKKNNKTDTAYITRLIEKERIILQLYEEKRDELEEMNNEYKNNEENIKKLEEIEKEIIMLNEEHNRITTINELINRKEFIESQIKFNKNTMKEMINSEEEIRKEELNIDKKEMEELLIEYSNKLYMYENDLIKIDQEEKEQIEIRNKYNEIEHIKHIDNLIINIIDEGLMNYAINKKKTMLCKKINNILMNVGNYEIEIEIDNNKAFFYKILENGKINTNGLSGYERMILNISIRIALNSMNIVNKYNYLIIDEGMSSADNENIIKICNIFEMIKSEYEICILISHIDEIKNQNGKNLHIKTNEKEDKEILI